MEKVIAVIVSYNRQALLAECIKALKSQTRKPDAILVVNNGSTDNTAAWLAKQKNIHHITQNNVGSAGGFNAGIEWAYANGYSWIWCMDDDGYPKNDALEYLLANEGHERALLNCAVINKEDKKSFVWNTNNYKTIDEVKEKVIEGFGHPFNGTLIHRSIIAKVGTPKSNLFLWGDETEYYYRITRRYDIPVKTVAQSIHYHPASAYCYKNDWNYQSTWKMYYYVRNRFHILQSKYPNKLMAIAGYLYFVTAFAGVTMLYQKTDKLRKLSFILWPVTDAFRNNFSATPPVILEKLSEQHAKSYSKLFLDPVRNFFTSLFMPSVAERQEPATA
jgi:GT2 family glycosyltransferase